MTKEEIFKRKLDKIANISKKFGAKRVIIFGSCVKDTNVMLLT